MATAARRHGPPRSAGPVDDLDDPRSLPRPEIRKKVLFTFAMLGLYRLGAYIPAPSVNTKALQSIEQAAAATACSGCSTPSRAARSAAIAMFALGIMPYITASIMLQILRSVVPSLEKLSKEGEVGQARITQYTRYLTVGLAFAQSIGYVFLFKSLENQAGVTLIQNFNVGKVFLIVITLTAGTVLLMWMGELITQRGIGNGISLMIFASIVSRIPTGVQSWWNSPDQSFKVMMPFIVFAVVAADRVRADRTAPDPGPVRQTRDRSAHDSGRPDLHPAHGQHGQRDPGDLRRHGHGGAADDRSDDRPEQDPQLGDRASATFLSPGSWHYVVGECILIILFTYFYTAIVFNPIDQAENLKKYGGFIPGIRPGRPTAEFLDRVLARLTFPGALFLAFIAALPTILIAQTGRTSPSAAPRS